MLLFRDREVETAVIQIAGTDCRNFYKPLSRSTDEWLIDLQPIKLSEGDYITGNITFINENGEKEETTIRQLLIEADLIEL